MSGYRETWRSALALSGLLLSSLGTRVCNGRKPETRRDHGSRRRRLFPTDGRGRGGHGASGARASRRSATGRGGTWGPHRQDDRRWTAAGVPLRHRRRRMRGRDPDPDGRAQRRRSRGEARRLSHRRQPRRRVDRGRRHPWGGGQYRGAPRGDLQPRRRPDLGRGPRSCARQDRRGICRSGREVAGEHRAAGAGICGQDKPRRGGARAPSAAAPERQGPQRLSIVALPFANLGGGDEQEYFADGVTESLTTDLSRIRGSFAICRTTAFTYKGKAFDLKQTGRELNVRYVLEGSVQRGGNRMRVNVQLIDAETG